MKTYSDDTIARFAASFASVNSEENTLYKYRFMAGLTPRQEKLFLDEYTRLKKQQSGQTELFKGDL